MTTRALTLAAALITLGAASAHAQDASSDPVGDEPGAEAAAEGDPAEGDPTEGDDAGAEDEDPSFAEARTRFLQGVALARAGNCSGALAELSASFELVPRPNTLYNIAQCQEELHRYDLAVQAYGRYLELAPAEEPERAAVEATMRALRMLLGTIRIESNAAAEVWLDDRVVGHAPGDVLVPGGRHVIELRADGFLPERQEIEVAAQRTVPVAVTLRTAEENVTIEQTTTIERPPLPTALFWSGVVLSAVTFAAGGYFGVSALLLADQERAREDPRLPPNIDAIEESALIADVLFLTGLVFTTATVVIAFLTDFGASEEAAAADPDGPAEPEVRARLLPAGLEVTW